MEALERMKKYLKAWDEIDGLKPSSNIEFIKDFVEFAKASDDWEFEGENGYCGYTAKLHEYPPHLPVCGLEFEFAYGPSFVKVFNGRNSGFWVPEYLDLRGGMAWELLGIIKYKLNAWAGF